MLSTKAAQKELLAKVLTAKDKDCEIEGKPGVFTTSSAAPPVPKPMIRAEAILNYISKKKKMHFAGGDGAV